MPHDEGHTPIHATAATLENARITAGISAAIFRTQEGLLLCTMLGVS